MRLDPIRPPLPMDPEWEEEHIEDDLELIDAAARYTLALKQGDTPLAKRLSRNFGSRQRRRAQLIARLKQARDYPDPVRGGTGKQSRTRRRKF